MENLCEESRLQGKDKKNFVSKRYLQQLVEKSLLIDIMATSNTVAELQQGTKLSQQICKCTMFITKFILYIE